MLVELNHLSKTYENGIVGLADVTMEIRDGIFGLLGPNGAGKTTLMRILATLLDPTSGSARVDGYDVRTQRPEVRRILGYLPQRAGFYPQLTVTEYLDFVGLLYGLGLRERRRAVRDVIDRVNLVEQRSRRVAHLSGGMKQRLGIAQAVLADPRLVIVDEPTAGLDPEERIRVRNLLTELSGDRVIILSTHIVADMAASATAMAIMSRGEAIFYGTPTQLIRQVEGRVWWVTLPQDQLPELSRHGFVVALERTANGLRARLLASEVQSLRTRFHVESAEPNLEDSYIWTMGDTTVIEEDERPSLVGASS